MLNIIKVKLLSERTSGVPPVIFFLHIIWLSSFHFKWNLDYNVPEIQFVLSTNAGRVILFIYGKELEKVPINPATKTEVGACTFAGDDLHNFWFSQKGNGADANDIFWYRNEPIFLYVARSESLEKVQRGEIQVVKRVKLKGKFQYRWPPRGLTTKIDDGCLFHKNSNSSVLYIFIPLHLI